MRICSQCGIGYGDKKVVIKVFEVTVCNKCYEQIEKEKEKRYKEIKELIDNGNY